MPPTFVAFRLFRTIAELPLWLCRQDQKYVTELHMQVLINQQQAEVRHVA